MQLLDAGINFEGFENEARIAQIQARMRLDIEIAIFDAFTRSTGINLQRRLLTDILTKYTRRKSLQELYNRHMRVIQTFDGWVKSEREPYFSADRLFRMHNGY